MKYKNLTELRQSAPKFFELSSKVEQYLRTVDDIASAIGYQKIWEAVNTYVKDNKINLADANTDVDGMIEAVNNVIKEYDTPLKDTINYTNESIEWYKVKK